MAPAKMNEAGGPCVPAPLVIPARRKSNERTASRALQETDRSCLLPSQGADWGFAPMTGFAPSAKDLDQGNCLLPSQGGGWGFAEESCVTTPEPGQTSDVPRSGTRSGRKEAKSRKKKGADENVSRANEDKAGVPLKTPPASRTPSSVTIDCSPSGLEGLRSRAGERPQSRVPNYGLASDLGICERPPTKHRGGGTPGAAALRNTGESRRMNRGAAGGFSRGGQREPSRGIGGGMRGFTGGRGMGGGSSYTPMGSGAMGSAMGSARGKPPRRERRGSNHGESGMTIGCDAYRKAGQMGGSMAYM